MFLLDTNVISETAKLRPNSAVMNWLASVPKSSVFLSSVTIGDLQRGAERARNHDPAKAERLEAWIDALIETHHCLSFDVEAAKEWARMLPKATNQNAEDAMIAAIARAHRLTVVTRNLKDFTAFGVSLFNPFD